MTPPIASSPTALARFAVVSFDRHPETSTGLARQVNHRLRTFGLDNVTLVDVDTLTPELSGQLARVDYAIFVDSPRAGNQIKVKVRSLQACGTEPAGSSSPAAGHSCDPCSLLALTHSVYGHHPQAWLVQMYVPTLCIPTSDAVEGVLTQTVREVESLLRQSPV
jgi:Ni,Fe-hydrogenase maturation factor